MINRMINKSYSVLSTTVWGGKIVENHNITYNADGNIINNAFVNCFGYGKIPVGEEYTEEYWSMVVDNFMGWDKVIIQT